MEKIMLTIIFSILVFRSIFAQYESKYNIEGNWLAIMGNDTFQMQFDSSYLTVIDSKDTIGGHSFLVDEFQLSLKYTTKKISRKHYEITINLTPTNSNHPIGSFGGSIVFLTEKELLLTTNLGILIDQTKMNDEIRLYRIIE